MPILTPNKNSPPLFLKEDHHPDYSFREHPLLVGRHRIHSYPAMLHPMLIESLLRRYATDSNCFLDPFCGSGTSLLSATNLGIPAFGIDINPLALLIARAKTTIYDFDRLHKDFEALKVFIQSTDEFDIPDIPNMDYWYHPDVVSDLARIRHALLRVPLYYIDFFVATYSHLARKYSLTRLGEFKRYRRADVEQSVLPVQLIAIFLNQLLSNINLYASHPQPTAETIVELCNVIDGVNIEPKPDIVITSPPYGDSRTTVAYGQYSSFGLAWTRGMANVEETSYQIDTESLGRRHAIAESYVPTKFMQETVNKISQTNQSRAEEVLAYLIEYQKAIKVIVEAMAVQSTICCVIGNRTVSEQTIPLDRITESLFLAEGLAIEGIYPRTIGNKVLPTQNSPKNRQGQTGNTITREYIVVAHKFE